MHDAVPRAQAAAAPGDTEVVDETSATPERAATSEGPAEDALRRALADLDNLRKRYDRELARERDTERRRVAAAWLPVVDNLDRALDDAESNEQAGPGRIDCEGLLEGVRAVRLLAIEVLTGLGFPRFDDVGKRFDPQRDEALSAVDGDPPGMVVGTVRPGYGAGEDVLRPSGVVVSRGPG
jgi:molecular chaperone GrpE